VVVEGYDWRFARWAGLAPARLAAVDRMWRDGAVREAPSERLRCARRTLGSRCRASDRQARLWCGAVWSCRQAPLSWPRQRRRYHRVVPDCQRVWRVQSGGSQSSLVPHACRGAGGL